MNIKTQHIYPPIPVRSWDWCAWLDGKEDGIQGWGRTEAEAIADLKQQMEDGDDFSEDLAWLKTM